MQAFRRADLAMRRRDWIGAVWQLRRAIRLQPDEPAYHAALAWALYCRHPGPGAPLGEMLGHAERAVTLDDRHSQAHFYKGLILRRMGRPKEALMEFEYALSVDPSHIDAAREVHLAEKRSHRPRPGVLTRILGR